MKNKRGQMPAIFLKKNRRGQIEISFGMIFSIILIVAFIALAGYVIYKFVAVGNDAQVKTFIANFQEDVDDVWQSDEASWEKEYNLPEKIEAICFVERKSNLEFQSEEFFKPATIEHIDTNKTILTGDSFCIEVLEGKIKLTIKKEGGEALVTITE